MKTSSTYLYIKGTYVGTVVPYFCLEISISSVYLSQVSNRLSFFFFFLVCSSFTDHLELGSSLEILFHNFLRGPCAIMSVFVVSLLLFLAMAGHSDAAYCVCSTGGDSAFQKNIDYACGNGADCSAILQNGACYNPNTVKDHCNYAVNSYYQRKGQIAGSCDFSGTAIVSPTPPNTGTGCVYQSSPSTGGSTTPSTNPNVGGTPNTGGTTTGGTMPGSTLTPGIGLAPSTTGFGNTDSASVTLLYQSTNIILLLSFCLTLFLMWPRI